METLQQQLMFAGLALLCAGMASVHDIRERRIPNWLTLPVIALGLIVHSVAGGWRGVAVAVSVHHGRLRETIHNVGALLLHHGSRGLKSHPDLKLSNAETLRLPFALPIAAGCLFTFCTLAWESRS